MRDWDFPTRDLTLDRLLGGGLAGAELLFEALLRRGFLVFRDDEGIWLGTGSHPLDLGVLSKILTVGRVWDHPTRLASLDVAPAEVPAAVRSILLVPQHRMWSSTGRRTTWARYRKMVWGHRVPVSGAASMRSYTGYGGLDVGVALLVKALPLARVHSVISCDGHGTWPAYVRLNTTWDRAWAEAVLERYAPVHQHSSWSWPTHLELSVAPLGGYSDDAVWAMLGDIQSTARRLMEAEVIDATGAARARTLERLGATEPSRQRFLDVAREELGLGPMPHRASPHPFAGPEGLPWPDLRV